MNIKEIVEKIKLFLNEEAEETEVQLVDVKTQDGIILSFEVLEVGAEIFVIDEAGRTPAPDGEYILEDNSKIVVVEGKIAEIVPAEEPVEEPEAEVEIPVEEVPVEATEVDLSAEVAALKAEIVSIKETLAQIVESNSAKELKEEIKLSMVEQRVEQNYKLPITEQKLNNVNRFLAEWHK
jgi:hypothetical protein